MQQNKFDLWCVVELFGHTKIAGRCSEENIAGTNMLRVDVPETPTQPAFTRFFGSSAIYAINPMDEDSVKFFAEQLEVKPIQAWDVKTMLQKNDQLRLALARGEEPSKKKYSFEDNEEAEEFDPDY